MLFGPRRHVLRKEDGQWEMISQYADAITVWENVAHLGRGRVHRAKRNCNIDFVNLALRTARAYPY